MGPLNTWNKKIIWTNNILFHPKSCRVFSFPCYFQSWNSTALDFSSTYGEAIRFFSDVQLTDADFVRVQCYTSNGSQPIYTNFYALARLKPDVERSCDKALDQSRPGHDDEVYSTFLWLELTRRRGSPLSGVSMPTDRFFLSNSCKLICFLLHYTLCVR